MSCTCNITIELSSPCGVEVTGGVAYSIGAQIITAVVTDPCSCLNTVYINGSPTTYSATDGEILNVTISTKTACTVCTTTGPVCELSLFLKHKTKDGKVKLVLNQDVFKKLKKSLNKRIKLS